MSLFVEDELRDYRAMMWRRRHPIPSAEGRTWWRPRPQPHAPHQGRALDWAMIGGGAVLWGTYVLANVWWPLAVP